MVDKLANTIADDVLYGAPKIALFLGWKARRVYQAREEGWSIPIRKREGLGIYAFKSELTAWLKADETLQRPMPRITILPRPKLLAVQAAEIAAEHAARVQRAQEEAERAIERLRTMERRPNPKASP